MAAPATAATAAAARVTSPSRAEIAETSNSQHADSKKLLARALHNSFVWRGGRRVMDMLSDLDNEDLDKVLMHMGSSITDALSHMLPKVQCDDLVSLFLINDAELAVLKQSEHDSMTGSESEERKLRESKSTPNAFEKADLVHLAARAEQRVLEAAAAAAAAAACAACAASQDDTPAWVDEYVKKALGFSSPTICAFIVAAASVQPDLRGILHALEFQAGMPYSDDVMSLAYLLSSRIPKKAYRPTLMELSSMGSK